MNSKNKIREILGDPPWDEELLRKCYAQSFLETREFIQNRHPGAQVYASLDSMRLSVDIFLNAVSDLISSINRFKGEEAIPGFWDRPYRQSVEDLEIAIQRGIASSAMCAMALVDHTRKFNKNYPIREYESKKNNYFENNEEHRFIHSLRVYISHVKISKANWIVSLSMAGKGRKVSFLLSQTDLLKWDRWTEAAMAYIKNSPKGVDIEALFERYTNIVIEFHSWLLSTIMDNYGEDISDYLKYLRLMHRFESQSHWNILIRQVFIPKNIDPYMYLNRYLTRQELEKVLSLPHRSKEQIDLIIALIDEYDACTEEIRDLVYRLFKVKEN